MAQWAFDPRLPLSHTTVLYRVNGEARLQPKRGPVGLGPEDNNLTQNSSHWGRLARPDGVASSHPLPRLGFRGFVFTMKGWLLCILSMVLLFYKKLLLNYFILNIKLWYFYWKMLIWILYTSNLFNMKWRSWTILPWWNIKYPAPGRKYYEIWNLQPKSSPSYEIAEYSIWNEFKNFFRVFTESWRGLCVNVRRFTGRSSNSSIQCFHTESTYTERYYIF